MSTGLERLRATEQERKYEGDRPGKRVRAAELERTGNWVEDLRIGRI